MSVFCISVFTASAQQKTLCTPSSVKKAIKYFDEAAEARKKHKDYKEVKQLSEKALEEDSSFAEAWHLLGDAAYAKKDFKTMEYAYIKLIELCPDAAPEPHYQLASILFDKKKYDEAVKYYQSFLDFTKVKEEDAKDAQQKITRAKLIANPVPFNPQPLKEISTPDPEYLAVISPDNELCFFTRRFDMVSKSSLTPLSVEKFMMAERDGDKFKKGEPMPPPFNKGNSSNEGGATISIDNKHLYFTVNKNGNFDIYTSDEQAGVWSEPRSIGDNVNDPKQWDSQPCIGPLNKTLYFATIRDSVNGTSDIYVTKKGEDGKWGNAHPLSAKINTAGNEKTPFLHPDSKTLYFSSDGLPGMGGYDIFYSRQDSNGEWGTPVNIGYPINTEADEVGFFVSTDGQKGYFASNSIAGSGGYDIYSFDLHLKARPEKVLFIKGDLRDENNDPPTNAKIELKNTTTKQVFDVEYDTITGRYTSVVTFDNDFILTVKKQGYAFNSEYFSKEDTTLREPKKVNLDLRKNEIGKAYTLNNILFATNSAELNPQDKRIIEDFADYLKLSNSLKVEIDGHTDNEGNSAANLKLSEDRAQAVYEYLIALGIDKSRLTYKGFGQSKPLQPNDTEEHKALNRRTEFVIIALK